MQAWEEKMYERLEGRKEGKEEGRKEGKVEGKEEGLSELLLDFLSELGPTSEELREKIASEKTPARLKEWNKLAAGAVSVEDFERKAGLS
ncbi:MAG: hypothetical protein Q4C82_07240, partial [Eubacteriales bacterium]|nr:hypothetical protein [Eubacteriales bacterium]